MDLTFSWVCKMLGTKKLISITGIVVIIIISIFVGIQISRSSNFSVLVDSSDFSISVDPMQGSIEQDGVLQAVVTVEYINGYEESVVLSSNQAPSGVLTIFSPLISENMNVFTSNLMIKVDQNVPVGTYDIEIRGQGTDGKTHSTYYTLNVQEHVETLGYFSNEPGDDLRVAEKLAAEYINAANNKNVEKLVEISDTPFYVNYSEMAMTSEDLRTMYQSMVEEEEENSSYKVTSIQSMKVSELNENEYDVSEFKKHLNEDDVVVVMTFWVEELEGESSGYDSSAGLMFRKNGQHVKLVGCFT